MNNEYIQRRLELFKVNYELEFNSYNSFRKELDLILRETDKFLEKLNDSRKMTPDLFRIRLI